MVEDAVEEIASDAAEATTEVAETVADAAETAADTASAAVETVTTAAEAATTPPAAEPSAPAAAPTPPAAPPAPKPLTAEERRALNEQYKETLDKFLDEVRAPGADFAAISKRYVKESKDSDIEVRYAKTEQPFTLKDPANELKDAKSVVSEIFQKDIAKDPIFHFRQPYGDGEGFYIVRIIDVEPERDLTLEEATEQIKETLVGVTALEKIEEDLKSAKEKLAEAKDGPAFKAAAEELGFKVERISYTRTPPTTEGIDTTLLRAAATSTVAGQISDPQFDEKNGGLLVYIAQKTVDEGEDAAERKKNSIAATIVDGPGAEFAMFGLQGTKAKLFQSWLQNVRKKYDIKVVEALQRNADDL